MKEKYLPIGTVVETNITNNKIMIVGYYGIYYNGKISIYDYKGIMYPEGLLSETKTFVFNHNNIKNVNFVGFESEEYSVLNKNLNKDKNDDEYKYAFDDNGVVTFDGKTKPEYSSINNVRENIKNPFNQKKEIKSVKKEEIPMYKFDANGVVISVNDNGNDLNKVSNNENSKFIFDNNGVVISVENENTTKKEKTNSFKFNADGTVVSENDNNINTEPEQKPKEFKFDSNGIVIAE